MYCRGLAAELPELADALLGCDPLDVPLVQGPVPPAQVCLHTDISIQ